MADFLTSSKGILSSISSKISVSEIGASTPPQWCGKTSWIFAHSNPMELELDMFKQTQMSR